ncbi:hypothetical protein CEXT_632551 [Caerostris extrusa]|uniref:Uncharacterized protein n=1 Tax=Caerostris extrusa TaxID=172846 RepID=A0AAV4RRF1_CAEEX|nr:hypothetical protein CEXT_632551 [Caerostris extrusa]
MSSGTGCLDGGGGSQGCSSFLSDVDEKRGLIPVSQTTPACSQGWISQDAGKWTLRKARPTDLIRASSASQI